MVDVIALALAAWHGLLVEEIFAWVVVLAPAQGLGVLLGNRRFLATSEEFFRRAVLLLILFIGIIGMVKSLAQVTGVAVAMMGYG